MKKIKCTIKKIKQVNKDGTTIKIWDSIYDLTLQGYYQSSIYRALCKHTLYKSFYWEYL